MNIIEYLNTNNESLEKSLNIIDSVNEISCHDHIHILYMLIDYLNDIYFKKNINYLEIGTFKGASISLCIQNKVNVNYVGIDLFEHCEGGHKYSIENVKTNINKYNIHNHKINLITGNSTHENTYNQINELYDIIFIDGDHSYNGVIKDFNIYSKFINKKGFIVFDDYVSIENVKKAVNNIIKNLDKSEWIIHGNCDNLLPNKCSRIHFKYHNKINKGHRNAYLDQGKYLKNNEYIIEKI
jgi:predicted O-methyltransferase YrrM